MSARFGFAKSLPRSISIYNHSAIAEIFLKCRIVIIKLSGKGGSRWDLRCQKRISAVPSEACWVQKSGSLPRNCLDV